LSKTGLSLLQRSQNTLMLPEFKDSHSPRVTKQAIV
jgi:hypothetical protein